MTNSWFAVPAALLWATVIWRWPARRDRPQRVLWLALVALAMTATLEVPVIEAAVDRLTPSEPNLVYLIKHLLVVGVAAAAHEVLREVVLDPAEAGRGRPARWGAAAIVVAVLSVLFFVAPVEVDVLTASFTERFGREPAMLGFFAVFLLWLSVALVATIRLTFRYARQASRGPLRTAIQMVGWSASACLGYAVLKGGYLAVAAAIDEPSDTVTGVYARVTLALLVSSMVLIVTGCSWPRLARHPAVQRLRRQRQLHRLRPLWEMLVDADPSIALGPVPAATGVARLGGTEVSVYRRVIEIRDGVLALRGYGDPAVRPRALAAARDRGVDEQDAQAIADAVWLEVARRRKLRGATPVADLEHATRGGADLETEVGILVAVSTAYRSSPLVGELADRLDDHGATQASRIS